MKRVLLPLMAAGLMLLSGCAAQYSISQQELTDYLNKEISFDVKQGSGIVSANLKLNQVEVRLGEKPDTMTVLADSSITISNPLLPLRATLTAEFEAKPWYDKHNQGIYLKDLQLTKVASNPKDLEVAIKGVAPELMRYIRGFLETQPVYVLNRQETNQAMLANLTEEIKVKPGKLVLVFK
ncbi:DUF1439 domain-containing protein [Shewanella submarina]|uniref:DUF1439 domain-containing protein n=1 Tax=Shewanella submarina TaxID=2016376 RepID=A0ABV7GG51_9GAMM|nr:DUF1439 domain-containing protein [Shewanella submarina]MCL1039879.1 DUF1439 domain-containing protein [Shewanella submarina]